MVGPKLALVVTSLAGCAQTLSTTPVGGRSSEPSPAMSAMGLTKPALDCSAGSKVAGCPSKLIVTLDTALDTLETVSESFSPPALDNAGKQATPRDSACGRPTGERVGVDRCVSSLVGAHVASGARALEAAVESFKSARRLLQGKTKLTGRITVSSPRGEETTGIRAVKYDASNPRALHLSMLTRTERLALNTLNDRLEVRVQSLTSNDRAPRVFTAQIDTSAESTWTAKLRSIDPTCPGGHGRHGSVAVTMARDGDSWSGQSLRIETKDAACGSSLEDANAWYTVFSGDDETLTASLFVLNLDTNPDEEPDLERFAVTRLCEERPRHPLCRTRGIGAITSDFGVPEYRTDLGDLRNPLCLKRDDLPTWGSGCEGSLSQDDGRLPPFPWRTPQVELITAAAESDLVR